MIIGVDLDEVLSDTLSPLIQFHNEKYGTSLEKKHFHSYKWWKVWGGTRDESVGKFFQFYKSTHFKNVKPLQDAISVINQLSRNHQLVVITSRQREFIKDTKRWIQKHFPSRFKDIFIINHADWAISGTSLTKAEICQREGVDVLIEDSLEYARECISDRTKVLLFDYPWNKGKLPKGVYRVHSWQDILTHSIFVATN